MLAPLKRNLIQRASAPYASTGRFNHGWARGKLAHDPVFAGLLDAGCIPNGSTVLDLGCGRGLLAAWLLAAERMAHQGKWLGQPQPPLDVRVRGVELMAREAEWGNRALQPLYGERVQLVGGDMRNADVGAASVVTILDVLHYIPHDEQERLLDRICAALPQGGRLIARVGDAGAGLRFRFSQWVDAVMWYAQGHRLPRSWCRPVDEWTRALSQRGLEVRVLPMSTGTPFANVLLVGCLPT